MKTIQLFLCVLVFTAVVGCNKSETTADAKPKSNAQLKTKLDTVSYFLGYRTGMDWKRAGLEDVDIKTFIDATKESIDGKESAIDLAQGERVVRSFIMETAKKKAEANLKKGEDFLAKNGKKKGIMTTPTGIQYEIIEEGGGAKPTLTETVKIDYHGTTIDGEVFDSSVEKEKPLELAVNRFVPGMTEALQLMPEGSKYKFYIPAKLGYGERGTPNIGPNEVLIFEVDMLEIIKPEEQAK